MRTGTLAPAAARREPVVDHAALRPLSSLEPTTAPDAELVAHARTDPAAFADLNQRHYRAVAGCIYRRTGDPHTTEDLTAETFVVALRSIGRYRQGDTPVLHWLLGIASRVVSRSLRDRRRAWRRRRALAPTLNAEAGPPREPPNEVALLLEALSRLPGEQQAVVSLHYFEGLGVEQVARALGYSVGTVKSRLFRARAGLRRRLEQEPRP